MLDAIRKKIELPEGTRTRGHMDRRMSSEDEQIQQRRTNLDELAKLGIEIYPRKFERRHTISELVRRLRRAHARRARGRAHRDDHQRPHSRDPRVRQGELPGALRRPARRSRSTSARTRCRSSISRSTSCSISATGSASKGGCSGPRPTSSRSGRRGCTSSRSACCRCRRSGTA